MAARRGRRHVRRVPGLVRDALLRVLHPALPRARRADRARRRDRVPQQAPGQAVARRAGTRCSRSRAPCPRCSGASRSPTSSAACRSTRSGTFTGNLLDLLVPYALLGGLTTLALFTFHGALFLTLRVDGDLQRRSRRAALATGPVAAILVLAFLVWTYVNAVHAHEKGIVPGIIPIAAIVPAVRRRHARARTPHRLRVRRDRALDRAPDRHALPQPVSARARLEHRTRRTA